MKVKDIKRFLDKVDEKDDNECWEWKGVRFWNNYGRFELDGMDLKAHRVSYIIFNNITLNDIPFSKNCIIMHMCDNPKCVNPKHLRRGSQKENIQDCINKKRRYEDKRKNMSV